MENDPLIIFSISNTVIDWFICLQVDMTKVNVDTLKPWIAQRITELLGLEDDVIVEFVYNQLEERVRVVDRNAHHMNLSILHAFLLCLGIHG